MKHCSKILTAIFALALLGSACHRNKPVEPSELFAPYISAYTGESVSSDASIRIAFTQEMGAVEKNTPVEEQLFSFSPSLKGTTYWEDGHTLVFRPDEGELRQGECYRGVFRLDKLVQVDRKLKRFRFSFRVQQRDFMLQLDPIEVTSAEPDKATIRGTILFNEPVTREKAEKMINVKGTNIPVGFQNEEKSDRFRFSISGIKKTREEQKITVTANGKPIGVKGKQTEVAVIPAILRFDYIASQPITEPGNGIRLLFSDPISSKQEIKGLIEVDNLSSYTVQVRENAAEIYYEPYADLDKLQIRIDKSLQSVRGRKLGREVQLESEVQPLRPQVALISEGVILPDADNLKLNFKAVSLNAVDLEVIRIYRSNILSFLQTNKLDEYGGIRRAGRLVCKKKLVLSPQPPTENLWHNYSVDLKKMFRQEEGGMYRVRLTFKREYATTPFYRSFAQRNDSPDMVPLKTVSAEDESKWDKPDYGYGYYEEWEYHPEYNWRDRNNPYTESYYWDNSGVATNLLASNLGMIVKGNESGTYWVTVNDILTTDAVRGAEITLYSLQLRKLASGRTGAKGTVTLQTPSKPFIAVASKGKQHTYLRLVEGENNSYSRFDVGGEKNIGGIKGFIYGERGVWRPGDTLHLTLILEDKDGNLPENHPVSLELFNPNGQFYCRKMSSKSIHGFHTFSIPTTSDAPTGLWNAYAHVGQSTFHKALHIETVKPNRLKIDIKLPDSMLDVRKKLSIPLQAAWLTGAVAQNLPVQVEMTLSKDRTPFKGYEKYSFVHPYADFPTQTRIIHEGRLSESGACRVELPALASDKLPGRLKAQFICRVSENGGDVSVVSKNARISPYSVYVGIRSNLSEVYPYIETNTDHRFDIVTLSPSGKLVKCSSLEYYIYKIDWSWWWEFDDEDFSSYINNSNHKIVSSGTLSTPNGKTSINFNVPYPEWGKYMVFVRDKNGGHATGCLVNVDWPAWKGSPDARHPSDIQMLSFSLDKQSYEVGESAQVTIPNLTSGTALVSIENGSKVLDFQRVEIKKGFTNFRFKVTEEMSPNAYVQIHVIQPHSMTADNLPIRLYGVEPFTVTDKKSRLQPVISCPTVQEPQKPFTVSVKEQTGRPMTYTLAVVDEGLLSLTGFKTPDPWDKFHAREALGIRTWDMYNYIVGAFAGKYARMFSVGGDENMEISPAKANRFQPVVKFLGPFTLKKGGTQSHTICLPQYIGAVRVMVVAAQDGAYGNAEKDITVRSPLMVLSSLPRVLSVNERVELPVNLFAMDPSVKSVQLQVETGGKAKVKGSRTQNITFQRTGDKTVYFTLETGIATGKEKITVTAKGNGKSAKEVIEIEIRNPNPLAVQTESRIIRPNETASLPYWLGRAGKENLLQLEVSTLPALHIADQYDFLADYGHLCSEQLVSKALPLMYKDRFVTLSEKEREQIRTNIVEIIGKLYSRQQPSGGFSYWSEDHQTSEWLTSYVGHFLILAKENGYDVNGKVYSQWLSYQQKTARAWQSVRRNAAGQTFVQSDLEQAYRLYTLALAGKEESGAMNRLRGSKTLSTQARWRLAAAYAVSGKQATAKELTKQASHTIPAYSSDNSTYGTPLRDEAMILETMLLTNQEEEAFRQARQLAGKIQAEMGYSTHSSAYTLFVLAQLYEKYSGKLQFEWSQNNAATSTVKTEKSHFQQLLPLKKLAGNVTVRNTGKGTIYASLYRRYRPLTDSTPAASQHLALQVRYTDLNGQPLDAGRLPQGKDFNVHIRVQNLQPTTACRQVALTYILPTGWEVTNDRYLSESSPASNIRISHQDIRDDRVLTYFDLPAQSHQEVTLRLRASYCGEYTLPAVRCEAMYDTHTYARTAAGKTVVYR